jgi:hypothetical protein
VPLTRFPQGARSLVKGVLVPITIHLRDTVHVTDVTVMAQRGG